MVWNRAHRYSRNRRRLVRLDVSRCASRRTRDSVERSFDHRTSRTLTSVPFLLLPATGRSRVSSYASPDLVSDVFARRVTRVLLAILPQHIVSPPEIDARSKRSRRNTSRDSDDDVPGMSGFGSKGLEGVGQCGGLGRKWGKLGKIMRKKTMKK